VYLERTLHEHEVRTDPYPAPHDVQRGGYSQGVYQNRKAEEVRHFFREFALEAAEFDRRYRPDGFVILGTDENVKKFLEFLSAPIREKVVHTAHLPESGIHAPGGEILERLRPLLTEIVRREKEEAVSRLHERVEQKHMAASGFPQTLERLQEGKVDTLVLATDIERVGAHCRSCGFYLDRQEAACPYCGGELRNGIDLVEVMIRMAEEQKVSIAFVPSAAMMDLAGVGALLRF
jgi:peptide subunit release factor 1 (eRF1)